MVKADALYDRKQLYVLCRFTARREEHRSGRSARPRATAGGVLRPGPGPGARARPRRVHQHAGHGAAADAGGGGGGSGGGGGGGGGGAPLGDAAARAAVAHPAAHGAQGGGPAPALCALGTLGAVGALHRLGTQPRRPARDQVGGAGAPLAARAGASLRCQGARPLLLEHVVL